MLCRHPKPWFWRRRLGQRTLSQIKPKWNDAVVPYEKDEWDDLVKQMNRIDDRVDETEIKSQLKMQQLEKRFVKRSDKVSFIPQKIGKRIYPTLIRRG